MPDVSAYETEAGWMGACVPKMIDEGRPQEQAVAACLNMWRQKSEKAAPTKLIDGENYPASDFLVVEDPQSPSTWHLQVKRHGTPDHGLMGGAWAALHGGYRGNRYEGPGKAEAIAKLKRLYASEEMPLPGEKAGRRLRGEWVKRLKELKAAAEAWLKGMGEMESWAEYADEEDESEPPKPDASRKDAGPLLFKAHDGRTWLLTWTTNAFEDRDKELFTTKAIEDYVTRHEGDEGKGVYQLWHMPGTEFGTIRWQAQVGRFLVEAGPFDQTPLGEQFKAFFEAHPDGHDAHAPQGWATSHGFSFKDGDRADGVYDWFEKHETSVLPFEYAANQHNPKPEVLAMNDKQKALLRDIGGEELVAKVLETGEAQTKSLEEQGIAYKAEETKAAPTELQPQPPDLKAIAEGLQLGALSEQMAQMAQAVKALADKVAAMDGQVADLRKADETRLAEKAADLPRFSWFRGSQAASTVLDEANPQDAALKAKKPVPGAIAAIAAKMSG